MSSHHSDTPVPVESTTPDQDNSTTQSLSIVLTFFPYATDDFVMVRGEECTTRPLGLNGFNYSNVWQVKSWHSFNSLARDWEPSTHGGFNGVCLSKDWLLGSRYGGFIHLLRDVRPLPAILDGRISDMSHAIRMSDGAKVELRSAMFTWDWRLVLRGRVNGVVREYAESELYVPTLESQQRILEEGVGDELFD